MTAIGPNRELHPALIHGMMRTVHLSVEELIELLEYDLENGLTFLDTSDIYADGYCEELLGKAFSAAGSLRKKFTLQSKCGIRRSPKGFTYYDFSTEYILKAADESLRRMQTDYMDYYLLHRPDALFEPEEVAEAFDKLKQSGKVLRFGVSNMNKSQLENLMYHVRQPIELNQLQFSPAHTLLIDSAIMTNRVESLSLDHDQGVLNFCRAKNCTIQAWSPFRAAKSEFSGGLIDRFARKIETRSYLNNEEFPMLNDTLNMIGDRYSVSAGAIVIAWILRHPADMQVVLGSSNTSRIRDALDGLNVTLTREEWYEIYLSAGNIVP